MFLYYKEKQELKEATWLLVLLIIILSFFSEGKADPGDLGGKTGSRMLCGKLGLVSQVSSLPSFRGNTALLLTVKVQYGGNESYLRFS